MKPTLPTHANRLQQQLLDVFRSLCVGQAKVVGGQQTGSEKMSDFRSRLEHQLKWQKLVTEAFLDVLQLRLDMEKSNHKYWSKFPTTGLAFQKQFMEATHNQGATADERSFVYLCLRPVVSAYPRNTENPRITVVVLAEVLVEGDSTEHRFD